MTIARDDGPVHAVLPGSERRQTDLEQGAVVVRHAGCLSRRFFAHLGGDVPVLLEEVLEAWKEEENG